MGFSFQKHSLGFIMEHLLLSAWNFQEWTVQLGHFVFMVLLPGSVFKFIILQEAVTIPKKNTALLRYNSHVIQSTIKVAKLNVFWCIHRAVQPLAQSILEHFHYPKQKLCTHQQSLPIPSVPHTPNLRQLLICPYRFAFSGHVIRMESYNIALCDWLLSFNKIFSRFIHVVVFYQYMTPSDFFLRYD